MRGILFMINQIVVFTFTAIILFFITGVISANESSYVAAVAVIEGIKNRIPDDDDYFRICSDSKFTLEPQERANLFSKIVFMQKTIISRADLLKIYEAKRNSIQNAMISYTLKYDSFIEQKYKDQYKDVLFDKNKLNYVFAFSQNKLYLDKIGKRWKSDSNRLIASYDDEHLRFVREPDSDLPNASINKQISFKFFYEPNMPLFVAMLFDVARCGYADTCFDMIKFLKSDSTHVFQQEKTVNGRICIIVLDTAHRVYLDKDRDYSVVCFEQFAHEFDPAIPRRLIGRSLRQKIDLYDLIDCGNGIWPPSRIEVVSFDKDKIISRVSSAVNSVQINKGIPDSFFTDIVPKNAFVMDAARNMSYKQSDYASINSLLKDTVKSKRVLIFRYISIISGLALIFIALTMKYRQYLEDKREREKKMGEKK